jgi:hypothetical protein
VESVYSAVRTDSLYKADYISSLKASASEPLTCTGPRPWGRGSSNVFTWLNVFEKFAKARYFNQNRLSIIGVRTAVK